MQKPIILFDIDYTLINTSLLKDKFANEISSKLKINKSAYIKYEKSYINTLASSHDLNIDDYIKKLASNFNSGSPISTLTDGPGPT